MTRRFQDIRAIYASKLAAHVERLKQLQGRTQITSDTVTAAATVGLLFIAVYIPFFSELPDHLKAIADLNKQNQVLSTQTTAAVIRALRFQEKSTDAATQALKAQAQINGALVASQQALQRQNELYSEAATEEARVNTLRAQTSQLNNQIRKARVALNSAKAERVSISELLTRKIASSLITGRVFQLDRTQMLKEEIQLKVILYDPSDPAFVKEAANKLGTYSFSRLRLTKKTDPRHTCVITKNRGMDGFDVTEKARELDLQTSPIYRAMCDAMVHVEPPEPGIVSLEDLLDTDNGVPAHPPRSHWDWMGGGERKFTIMLVPGQADGSPYEDIQATKIWAHLDRDANTEEIAGNLYRQVAQYHGRIKASEVAVDQRMLSQPGVQAVLDTFQEGWLSRLKQVHWIRPTEASLGDKGESLFIRSRMTLDNLRSGWWETTDSFDRELSCIATRYAVEQRYLSPQFMRPECVSETDL